MNAVADWLTNVAREYEHSTDCTLECLQSAPFDTTSPQSPGTKTTSPQLLLAPVTTRAASKRRRMLGEGPDLEGVDVKGGGLQVRDSEGGGAANDNPLEIPPSSGNARGQPSLRIKSGAATGKVPACTTCGARGSVIKRCWGCAEWLHQECAGGEKWGPGPTHCARCWEFFRAGGVREVALDTALMHQVVTGVPADGITTMNRARCEVAAQHLRWDGSRLYIRGRDGEERQVVPWCDRRRLVADLAAQLGFPGGKRLYQLARARYYWTSM